VTPYYADDWLTVYAGDCRAVLATLPAESVHCVVTSPPYWGLRDYGTATWDGGDAACDHKGKPIPTSAGFNERYFGRPSSDGNKQDDMRREVFRDRCGKCGATRIDNQLGLEPTPEQYVENMVAVFREVKRVLRNDGTLWLNLGDSYNGSGKGGNGGASSGLKLGQQAREDADYRQGFHNKPIDVSGLKPKDLVGIPWRVAFALQADGWVLRSDIVWAKPNPMPESVTDRPTKSHEMLFLFSKGKRIGPEPTKYDDIPAAEAQWIAGLLDCEGSIVIRREQPTATGQQHAAQVSIGSTSRELMERVAAIVGEGAIHERKGLNAPMHYWQQSGKRAAGLLRRLYPYLIVKQRQARCAIALEERKWYRGGHKQLDAAEIEWRERVWQTVKSLNHFGTPDLAGIPEPVFGRWDSQPYYFDQEAVREAGESYGRQGSERGPRNDGIERRWSGRPADRYDVPGRNIRSVWTVATQPYPGAHFATFPPKLIEPCIKAGTSERGVCPECGAPWRRVVRPTDEYAAQSTRPELHKLDRVGFREYLRGARVAAGLSRKDVDDALGTNTAVAWWEGRNYLGEFVQQVPTWDLYQRLKAVLHLDDRYDAEVRRVDQHSAFRDHVGRIGEGGPPPTSAVAPEKRVTTGRIQNTVGWQPSCAHDAEPIPATLLDPFAGSGTVGTVAQSLSRRAVLIDLNPDYIQQQLKRNAQTPLGLTA
jgi:DNA modification methylase